MPFIGTLNLPSNFNREIDQIGEILNDDNKQILVIEKFVITNEKI